MAEQTEAQRVPLDRATILAAAIDIADEEGVSGLSMRKLAGRLGFEAMSLYNHVANKDELLTGMSDAIASEIDVPADDLEPLAAVRELAIATRAVFVRHPWTPELWLRQMPGPARTDHMERQLRLLASSGLSPELAHHGFHAVTNHVLGYTLQAQGMQLDQDPTAHDTRAEDYIAGMSPDDHPHTINHVQQHIDGDTASSFELVLDLILDGLVRLDTDS